MSKNRNNNRRKREAKAKNQRSRVRKEYRRDGKRIARAAPGRSCGECSACCTVMGVPDDPKPKAGWENGQKEPWEPCGHVCDSPEGRCGIYANRPRTCRGFVCGWLEGLGSEDHRPDLSGVVLVSNADRTMVQVMEVWEGAARERLGKQLADQMLGRGLPVIVMHKRKRTLIQPTVNGRPIL